MYNRKIFSKHFLENCAFYGLGYVAGTGTVTCQKSKPDRNLSKVGTGIVKNSYSSATLEIGIKQGQYLRARKRP